MDEYLIGSSALAAAAVGALLLWLKVHRRTQRSDALQEQGRLDTLVGWPPEPVRMLRTSERAAYNVLTLAMPGQMIFAQVPLARFIDVPKRFSYAEWMRRLGSHCVDFVICDAASKVIAVVDVRPAPALINERLQRRLDRVSRTMKSVGIPLHVWIETALPTVEAARHALELSLGRAPAPAAPGKWQQTPAAGAWLAGASDGSGDGSVEVIEMTDARASTWFDELDTEPLPAPTTGLRSAR